MPSVATDTFSSATVPAGRMVTSNEILPVVTAEFLKFGNLLTIVGGPGEREVVVLSPKALLGIDFSLS